MKNRTITRFITTCLAIADYYSENYEKIGIMDDLLKEIGLGPLVVVPYLREGVKSKIDLESKVTNLTEKCRNQEDEIKRYETFLDKSFGNHNFIDFDEEIENMIEIFKQPEIKAKIAPILRMIEDDTD